MQRFFEKTRRIRSTKCLEWTAGKSRYGYFFYQGKLEQAHRVAWKLAHGSIPLNHIIHHSCGNKLCVNVKHLTSMPAQEHRRHHPGGRPMENLRTHCSYGHPWTLENIYYPPTGYRKCRQCCNRRQKEYYGRTKTLL